MECLPMRPLPALPIADRRPACVDDQCVTMVVSLTDFFTAFFFPWSLLAALEA